MPHERMFAQAGIRIVRETPSRMLLEELVARVGDEADLRSDHHQFPEVVQAFVPEGFQFRFSYPSRLHVIDGRHLDIEIRVQFWPPGQPEEVSSASRHFSTADGVANHMTLEIAESLQARGIGRRLALTATRLYDQLGINEVRLTAADIGRYVWAMCGFRPDDGQYELLAEAITDVARTLGYDLRGWETAEGLWQLYYDLDEHIAHEELADRLGQDHAGGGYLGLPNEPIRLGKALLLVNRVDAWTGTLSLGQNPGYVQLLQYNGE